MKTTTDFCNFSEYKYLIELIKAAVNNVSPCLPPQEINWAKLISCGTKTSTLNLAYMGILLLPKEQYPPQNILEIALEYTQVATVKDTNQIVEINKLQKFFEKEKIPNLFLKGSIIKNYYPRTDMRFMGDIDILVHSENVLAVEKELFKRGYTKNNTGDFHNSYSNSLLLHIELHKTAVPSAAISSSFFENIWQKAVLNENCNYTYSLTSEDLYLYVVDHAVRHFIDTGLSLRMVLDFYILNNKYKNCFNKNYLEISLKELKYTKFEKEIKNLSYNWFSVNGIGMKESNLEIYIVYSGTFGLVGNSVLGKSARRTKENELPSKKEFIIKQVFPPYCVLKRNYPILNKIPMLLPFIWVVYWFKRIFIKKDVKLQSNKNLSILNKSNTDFVKAVFTQTGFDNLLNKEKNT